MYKFLKLIYSLKSFSGSLLLNYGVNLGMALLAICPVFSIVYTFGSLSLLLLLLPSAGLIPFKTKHHFLNEVTTGFTPALLLTSRDKPQLLCAPLTAWSLFMALIYLMSLPHNQL